MRKKVMLITIVLCLTSCLYVSPVEVDVYAQPGRAKVDLSQRLCDLFSRAKTADLSFCLGCIKKSSYSNREIADFIVQWPLKADEKKIPSVFKSKIERVITFLRNVDYERLLMDIDLIKNSQLTVEQMVRIVKGAGSRYGKVSRP